ncbi:hypothetical protein JTF93_RS06755 [Escherichia coli]
MEGLIFRYGSVKGRVIYIAGEAFWWGIADTWRDTADKKIPASGGGVMTNIAEDGNRRNIGDN